MPSRTESEEEEELIDDENKCKICMLDVDDERVVTPCGHLYCSACFFRWMKERPTCPTCRKYLGQEDVTKRRNLLHSLTESIHSQISLMTTVRRDNTRLERKNKHLKNRYNRLEGMAFGKKKELINLERERLITRDSIRSMVNYRRRWETLSALTDDMSAALESPRNLRSSENTIISSSTISSPIEGINPTPEEEGFVRESNRESIPEELSIYEEMTIESDILLERADNMLDDITEG